ncbi:MAG: imidazole glycerol phosphate synthase subunit HisH [Anaerolineae bacterium]|nr:imidazole glycerol phosphate synthase subunit HisH [Anaerolineae bacterium]
MIALIDYGAGNVRSVHKALTAVGADVSITQRPEDVLRADKVVLPGVGAFGDCMAGLKELEMVAAIQDVVRRGIPFLGICVGMQVMFDVGLEMGYHQGLGLLPGKVTRFTIDQALKVPHTGWNQIEPRQPVYLLRYLPLDSWAYFNHSFICEAHPEHILATTDYGGPFACVVGQENVMGIQFHPEKSQHVGLHIMRNFVASGN